MNHASSAKSVSKPQPEYYFHVTFITLHLFRLLPVQNKEKSEGTFVVLYEMLSPLYVQRVATSVIRRNLWAGIYYVACLLFWRFKIAVYFGAVRWGLVYRRFNTHTGRLFRYFVVS